MHRKVARAPSSVRTVTLLGALLGSAACGKAGDGVAKQLACASTSDCKNGFICVQGTCRIDADASAVSDGSPPADAGGGVDASGGRRSRSMDPVLACPPLQSVDAGQGARSVGFEQAVVGVVRGGDGLAALQRADAGTTLCVYDPASLAPVRYVGHTPIALGSPVTWFPRVVTGGGVHAALLGCYYKGFSCGTGVLVEGWKLLSPEPDLMPLASDGLAVLPDGRVLLARSDLPAAAAPMSTAPVVVEEVVRGAFVERSRFGAFTGGVGDIVADATWAPLLLVDLHVGARSVVALDGDLKQGATWSPPEDVSLYAAASGPTIAVAGERRSPVTDIAHAWVMLLDRDLHEMWAQPYMGHEGSASSARFLVSGDLLLAGSADSVWVERVDASGTLVASTTIPGATGGVQVEPQSDGQILVTYGDGYALVGL